MPDEPTAQTTGTRPANEPGRVSRRRFLAVGAVAGVAIGAGGYATARRQGQEIRLIGRIDGWEGVAPPDIAGTMNPTLALTPGQDYTVTWENGDGANHNFAVRNESGENLVASEFVAEQGATQSVDFTASEEMAQYVCEVHPSSMVGDVTVAQGPPTGTGTPEETPTATDTAEGTPTETDTAEETPTDTDTPEETPDGVVETFRAMLSGEDHGIDTAATGRATFEVDTAAMQIRYTLEVQELCNATMAHIHLGGPNEDGPVVVWLYPEDQQAPRTKEGLFSGALASGAITEGDLVGPLAGESFDELRRTHLDGDAYVNVHTEEYPDGEIRGQIERATDG